MRVKLSSHRLCHLGGEHRSLVLRAMVALEAVLAFLFRRRDWI
jgi:hypothetical protein